MLNLKDCRECPLWQMGKPCAGVGPTDADVMVVGQAPGIEENKIGIPFIGQAGQFLSSCLESAGIDDCSVYYTNLVKHFPGRKAGGDDCPAYAIEACKGYLFEEIRTIQPKLIIAVGAIVMRFFGISGGINKNSGKVFDTEYGRVMPILHPAGLMRVKNMRNVPIFRTSLFGIKTELNGKIEPPPLIPLVPDCNWSWGGGAERAAWVCEHGFAVMEDRMLTDLEDLHDNHSNYCSGQHQRELGEVGHNVDDLPADNPQPDVDAQDALEERTV